jgi:hypothetical protein
MSLLGEQFYGEFCGVRKVFNDFDLNSMTIYRGNGHITSVKIPHCEKARKGLPMRLRFLILASALGAMSQMASAEVEASSDSAFFDSVMVYAAQGANHNLPELPGVILRGDVEWEPSYFTAISFRKTRGSLGNSFEFLNNTPLKNIQHGYEIVYAQHHGLQSNAELGLAFVLRTPDWNLGPVAVSAGAGVGLSHAFGRPSYEDGPFDNPDKRYSTQLLTLWDLNWKLRKFENISIVTRVHHRSGAYGVIAPRNVGSNFLAVGVRYDF